MNTKWQESEWLICNFSLSFVIFLILMTKYRQNVNFSLFVWDSGLHKIVAARSAIRVLKWWRHKHEISEIMGFVRIFWKNHVQEAHLPKMSISGQIVSEIVAQLCLENSIQTLLNFFGSTQKKLEGFVWSFLSLTG